MNESTVLVFIDGISHISVGAAFFMLFVVGVVMFVVGGATLDYTDMDSAATGWAIATVTMSVIGILGIILVWCVEHLSVR